MRYARQLWLLVLLGALALVLRVDAKSKIGGDTSSLDDDAEDSAPSIPQRNVDPLVAGEKFDFQAKTAKLLDILINTLYQNKDTPIRELISNASDALNKLRFALLMKTRDDLKMEDLKIEIIPDKERKTLTIRDYGVGMTKEDLINNLGTLAKSGTAEYLENQIAASKTNGSSSELIGQFGVGFYSAYLIAQKVTVRTRNVNSTNSYIWESMADNSFVIAEDTTFAQPVGTEITLHLKADADEYLDFKKLTDVIKTSSIFIDFPIFLQVEKSEEVEVPDESADAKTDEPAEKEEAKADDDDDVDDVDEKEAEDKKPKTKKVKREYTELELMNPHKAIWRRDPKEVQPAEYVDFYKALIKDWKEDVHHKADPTAWSHFRSEGSVQFYSLLYIPGEAKPNALQSASNELPKNIKLFVKKVFITDEIEDFLPRYLSFVKGAVDSDDLPLNVNREHLQQTRLLRSIKKKIISKTLDMLKEISKDPERWPKFQKAFGTNLKLGVMEDTANKEKLLKLIRFHSSSVTGANETTATVTLDDYISRMKKKQSGIFFLSGASLADIKNSPFLEKPLARGYEVLYMPDPIDEYLMQSVTEYAGKQFKSIAKEGLKYGDEDKDTKAALKEEKKKFLPLTKWMASVLEKDVDKVVLSPRLTSSPAAIVAKQFGWSGNMERIMNSQALGAQENFMRDFYAKQKKILEINPSHPLIKGLLRKVEGLGEDAKPDSDSEESIRVLYDATLVTSGYQIADVPNFAKRIELVIRRALNVDESEKADVKVTKAAEKVEGEVEEEEPEAKDQEDEDDDDEESSGSGLKRSKGKFDMPEMPEMPDLDLGLDVEGDESEEGNDKGKGSGSGDLDEKAGGDGDDDDEHDEL